MQDSAFGTHLSSLQCSEKELKEFSEAENPLSSSDRMVGIDPKGHGSTCGLLLGKASEK